MNIERSTFEEDKRGKTDILSLSVRVLLLFCFGLSSAKCHGESGSLLDILEGSNGVTPLLASRPFLYYDFFLIS